MKHSLIIFLTFLIVGFKTIPQQKHFQVTYLNKIVLSGVIDEEDPDYVSHLKCRINGVAIYQADSLAEFEFKERLWPKAKQVGKDCYQLFLELNDRPDKNKILLLTINDGKVLQKQTIPTFDVVANTANGYREYSGTLEYPEATETAKKTQYIPTLFYNDLPNGFVLDTAKTIAFNTRKWGKFYGFKPNFQLLLIPNKVSK